MTIDRTALDRAKPALKSYLQSIGLNPDQLMHCLFHHPDIHPSMSYIDRSNTVYCHACKTTADIVNVIAAVEGYEPNSKDAINRAIEWAGTADIKPATNTPTTRPKNAHRTRQTPAWIAAADSDVAMSYLKQRGFTDDDAIIIEKYKIAFDPQTNCLIIPHDGDYYTARKIDAVDKSDRFRHNPARSVEIFNSAALDSPVACICEGAIDALSLLAIGIKACAIGGAGTQSKLINAINAHAVKPNVIICFDNDDAGKDAAAKLAARIQTECNTFATVIIPKIAHDMNDAFKSDRETLRKFMLITTEKIAKKHKPASTLIDEHRAEPEKNAPPIDDDDIDGGGAKDYTDYGLAEQILDAFPNDIRYNTTSGGKFMIYEPPIWRTLNKDGEMRAIVKKFRDLPSTATDARANSMLKNDTKVNRVISMMRSFDSIYITNDDLNRHPNLLNVLNGVIDLDSKGDEKVLYPHSGEYYMTRQAQVFYDPDQKCPEFDKFYASIIPDEDTRGALLTFLGYCLSGRVNAETALFIHGTGGNGKGTLFRTVMNLMGDYAVPIKIDALLAAHRQQDSQSATPEFNKLEYARLAVAEEVPKNRKLDAAQFKLLTGGDYLPIRRLHQEATIIKNPSHKLVLSGNALPQLSDPDDQGLQRRLMVINFPNSFTGEQCNPFLKEMLNAPSERSGLLNLMIKGYKIFSLFGLATSKLIDDEKASYLADNDCLTAFIEDYCIIEPNAVTKRKDLLEHVKTHGNFDLRSKPDKDIIAAFTRRPEITYKRTKQGYIFEGIRLQTDGDQ